METRDIKFYGSNWKSKEYVRWIRDNTRCCICSDSLLHEKEAYESHHWRHVRRTDATLSSVCLLCHNKLHIQGLEKKWESRLMRSAEENLIAYIKSKGGEMILLHALAQAAEKAENEKATS